MPASQWSRCTLPVDCHRHVSKRQKKEKRKGGGRTFAPALFSSCSCHRASSSSSGRGMGGGGGGEEEDGGGKTSAWLQYHVRRNKKKKIYGERTSALALCLSHGCRVWLRRVWKGTDMSGGGKKSRGGKPSVSARHVSKSKKEN
jgi:hypothetical protein